MHQIQDNFIASSNHYQIHNLHNYTFINRGESSLIKCMIDLGSDLFLVPVKEVTGYKNFLTILYVINFSYCILSNLHNSGTLLSISSNSSSITISGMNALQVATSMIARLHSTLATQNAKICSILNANSQFMNQIIGDLTLMQSFSDKTYVAYYKENTLKAYKCHTTMVSRSRLEAYYQDPCYLPVLQTVVRCSFLKNVSPQTYNSLLNITTDSLIDWISNFNIRDQKYNKLTLDLFIPNAS